MRARLLLAALSMFLLTGVAVAQEDSETDRLREALRDSIQQNRALEDQRAALQAQLTDATRDRDRYSSELNTTRTRLKNFQKAYNTAVTEFNARLEERNQVLEKWRTAYEDAADVAREKDAERAKYQAEDELYKASTKDCLARNAKLFRVSNDILVGYRDLNMWKVLAVREPMIGIGTVDHENKVQTYLDRILDQKAVPVSQAQR